VFGINGGELLVLFLVAAFVIGPERLPRYAEQLGHWVRRARQFAADAKARVDEELGEEARDVDWAALDPRKYDPRRIVREALLDDLPPSSGPAPARPSATARTAAAATAGAATAATAKAGVGVAGDPGERWRSAPFDDEAT
jgi:sec-independent protein translocase protein TatB